ncbi:uncharacterized protein LOC134320930 [Trichomycterus rosablanca]|uniref:uncharacterized protein LOC134320930 n=1 Tax=Trichomycterus rosablanca TaxID=2290929 RepID=UPI002F360430
MGALNLRIASTTAKLEEWVSDPRNSQKLIDDLEKKLAQGEMEALEDYLKDKKLKRSLCFYADDVDKIRNNDELGWFLDVMNGTKFPKSVLDLFFQNTDYNPPNNLKMEVHPEIYTDFRLDFRKNNDLATPGGENVAPNQQRNTGTSGVVNEGKQEPSPSNNAPSARNKNNVLLDWAVKQSNVSEKELKQVFDNISIKNVVEHREYQFFVAENVMVYKKPETGEQEILVVTDENS